MKERILGPLECAVANKFWKKIGCNKGVSKPAGMACMPTGKGEHNKGKPLALAKELLYGGQGKTTKLNNDYTSNTEGGMAVLNSNTGEALEGLQPP